MSIAMIVLPPVRRTHRKVAAVMLAGGTGLFVSCASAPAADGALPERSAATLRVAQGKGDATKQPAIGGDSIRAKELRRPSGGKTDQVGDTFPGSPPIESPPKRPKGVVR
jgi:hypothetical protein